MACARLTFLLPLLLLSCAPPQAPVAPPPETAHRAIVGGLPETGWSGVGALATNSEGGYTGSFCTGTLVDLQWVLTAAHCLVMEGSTTPKDPAYLMFYVGQDATPASGTEYPEAGYLYQADAVHIHPGYDPVSTANDLALLHLSKKALGVDVVPMSLAALDGSFINQQVLYVGFGINNVGLGTGSGIKRSGTMPLVSFYTDTYLSKNEGTGICFGDSGGPGLLQLDGEWRLIGVNSSVAKDEESGATCYGYGIHTRVDAYLPWIHQKLGLPIPLCTQHPEMCVCPEACKPTGQCDDTVCGTLGCAELYDCAEGCAWESACMIDCSLAGKEGEYGKLWDMLLCIQDHCWTVQGSARAHCMLSSACIDSVSGCYEAPAGAAGCEALAACAKDCGTEGMSCLGPCWQQGTSEARELLVALYDCYFQSCAGIYSVADWNACAAEHCGALMNACMPPAGCDPLGGTCPFGEACVVTASGALDCVKSKGSSKNAPCNPAAKDPVECADGLACVKVGGAETCTPLCLADGDCEAGRICYRPVFQNNGDVGICFCQDQDKDGTCSGLDCDDGNVAVRPGHEELCDGLDNDCDGVVDPGCSGAADTVDGPDAGAPPDAGTPPAEVHGGPPDAETPGGDVGGGGCAAAPGPPAGCLLLPLLLALLPYRRGSSGQRCFGYRRMSWRRSAG